MRFATFFGVILGLSIILLAGCSNKAAEPLSGQEITVFKTSNCGCCEVWAKYIGKEGFKVDVQTVENLNSIKAELKIPLQLQSCHTAKIGDYFVEGHIPAEAIEKLVADKPDIAGIAMPGMPSGSPGMPGRKTGEWIIYSIHHDGSYDEFMRV